VEYTGSYLVFSNYTKQTWSKPLLYSKKRPFDEISAKGASGGLKLDVNQNFEIPNLAQTDAPALVCVGLKDWAIGSAARSFNTLMQHMPHLAQ
jgi:hypothetical protein